MEYKPGEKKTASFLRSEIEKIIKEEKVDRSRFCEFSKFQYENILKKFYYAFSDYTHFTPATLSLNRKRLHIRGNLKSFSLTGVYAAKSWTEYLKILKSALPLKKNEKLFLILSTGWVYEGYANEIVQVLSKVDIWIQDFFIVSPKFDWFIAHDFIDLCAFIYQK